MRVGEQVYFIFCHCQEKKNTENKGRQNQRRVKEKGKSLEVEMRTQPFHTNLKMKFHRTGLGQVYFFCYFFPPQLFILKDFQPKNN